MTDPSIVDRVRDRLVAAGTGASPALVAAALREQPGVLGDTAVLHAADAVLPELSGAGRLDRLLRDQEITDVLVNGPHQVWVDRGSGLERTRITFPDDAAVRRLAQRLAAAAGRRLDDACPYVDATRGDGVRIHAVLAPIAAGGTCLSLRIPRRRSFTLAELVSSGTLPPEGADWLHAVIAARLAFVVSGGAGTGKTTVLSTLLSLVSPDERVVLVEDTPELRPDHPHVVRLAARPANVEGAGAVTLRELVRQALRMRPDRLVVGEARGGEVAELLSALNTGHEGGCGTLHANGPAEVPARMEALAALGGVARAALHSQLAAGLDAVVHLGRDRSGGRRVRGLAVLRRDPEGWVTVMPALEFQSDRRVVPMAGAQVVRDLLRDRGVVL